MFQHLVAHLRHERAPLRQEWARRIHDARLLTATVLAIRFAAGS